MLWRRGKDLPDADWRRVWLDLGTGLALLDPDAQATWQFVRSDRRPWETEWRDDREVPCDPVLYDWLWFSVPHWGAVPAYEVPPQWLVWNEDRTLLTVARAPHDPQELRDWAAETPGGEQPGTPPA